jgi:hypothetical protein
MPAPPYTAFCRKKGGLDIPVWRVSQFFNRLLAESASLNNVHDQHDQRDD